MNLYTGVDGSTTIPQRDTVCGHYFCLNFALLLLLDGLACAGVPLALIDVAGDFLDDDVVVDDLASAFFGLYPPIRAVDNPAGTPLTICKRDMDLKRCALEKVEEAQECRNFNHQA